MGNVIQLFTRREDSNRFERWWHDLKELARRNNFRLDYNKAQFKEFYFEDGLTPEETLKEEMYYGIK